MAWPRERWIDHLPEHEGLLEAVPDVLDRETVRRACADANVDGTRAAAAFITVMAWGYGGVGYGPHRTRRILTGTPDAGDRLAEASRRLGKHGAVAAYASLSRMDACRLVGLGPAFGTKYLYFSQARPADTTALILDSFVASWVRRETDLDLNPLGWSVATYQRSSTRCTSGRPHWDVRPMTWNPASFRRWRRSGTASGARVGSTPWLQAPEASRAVLDTERAMA